MIATAGLWWYFNPACERIDGIIYGHRDGQDLTLSVVRPPRQNGAGIVLMVSGRWKSRPESFEPWMAAPMLRRGYTIFAVSHRSQPGTSVQATVADVHRAVRYIRHHAAAHSVDPQRIGVTGGSSGGHLCLMLATRGGPGPVDAADPVDRESSAVQAVAILFPVTNLLDLGSSTENAGDGGPPKSFREAFGEEGRDLRRWPGLARELSPVYHCHREQPPVFILHGSADTLVPLEQSQWFSRAAADAGAPPVELVVREGKKHGWLSIVFDLGLFADWFDQHLRSPEALAGRTLRSLR